MGANPGRFFALVTIGLNNFDLNIKKTECRLRYQETVLGCLKKIWPGKDALFALDSHWDKVDKPFSKCAFVIGFIFGTPDNLNDAVSLYNLLIQPTYAPSCKTLISFVAAYLEGAAYKQVARDVGYEFNLGVLLPQIQERYDQGVAFYGTRGTRDVVEELDLRQRSALQRVDDSKVLVADLCSVAFLAGYKAMYEQELARLGVSSLKQVSHDMRVRKILSMVFPERPQAPLCDAASAEAAFAGDLISRIVAGAAAEHRRRVEAADSEVKESDDLAAREAQALASAKAFLEEEDALAARAARAQGKKALRKKGQRARKKTLAAQGTATNLTLDDQERCESVDDALPARKDDSVSAPEKALLPDPMVPESLPVVEECLVLKTEGAPAPLFCYQLQLQPILYTPGFPYVPGNLLVRLQKEASQPKKSYASGKTHGYNFSSDPTISFDQKEIFFGESLWRLDELTPIFAAKKRMDSPIEKDLQDEISYLQGLLQGHSVAQSAISVAKGV